MEFITTGKEKDTITIAIKGKMDAVTAPEFDSGLGALIAQGENSFILDMGALEYISSAGLRSILAAGKKLKGSGGRLMIASLGGTVKEVFEISGFDALFPVFGSVSDALGSL